MQRLVLLLVAAGAACWSIDCLLTECPSQQMRLQLQRRLRAEEDSGADEPSWQAEADSMRAEIQELKSQVEKLRAENAEIRSDFDAIKVADKHAGDKEKHPGTTDAGTGAEEIGEAGSTTTEHDASATGFDLERVVSEQDAIPADPRQWHWATWLSTVLLCLCCGAGFVISCSYCFEEMMRDFDRYCTSCANTLSGYVIFRVDDGRASDSVAAVVRREMRFMLLYPLLPMMAFPWTNCEDGMPLWTYAVYFVLLVRTKYIEIRILNCLGKADFGHIVSLGFLLGMLEHADWYTDGAFPIQAQACDPEATALFAYSFETSMAWPLAPIVRCLHYWGIFVILLLASALAQQTVGGYYIANDDDADLALSAEVSGMGAVVEHYAALGSHDSYVARDRKFWVALTKVFLENLCQLWLQASYYGIVFARVGDEAKIKILLSICLGLASATYKSVLLAVDLYHRWGEMRTEIRRFSCLLVPLSWGMICWVSVKLYYSHKCASHLWNLSSGCVV